MTEPEQDDEVPSFTTASFAQRFQYKTGSSEIANGVFADVKSKFMAKEKEQDANPNQNDNPAKRRLRKKLHLQTQRGQEAKKAQLEHDMEDGDFSRTRQMLMRHQNKGLPKSALKLPKQLQPLLASMAEMKQVLQQAKESGLSPVHQETTTTTTNDNNKPSVSKLPLRPPVEDDEKLQKAARNRRKRENKKKKIANLQQQQPKQTS